MGRPRANAFDTSTPDRLLEAAAEEFALHGFQGARLEDIARRAGIRRPSLLYHFSSKDAIYAAIVRSSFERLEQALFAAIEQEGSFEERVTRTAQRFASFLDEEPSLSPIVLRELLDRRGPGSEVLLNHVAPLLDTLEAVVRREGGDDLNPSTPIRGALVQLASDLLLRSAAGPVRQAVWGDEDNVGALARALFLKEPQ